MPGNLIKTPHPPELTPELADELADRVKPSWLSSALSAQNPMPAKFSDGLSAGVEHMPNREAMGTSTGEPITSLGKRPVGAAAEGHPASVPASSGPPSSSPSSRVWRSEGWPKSVEAHVALSDIEEIPSRRALARRDTLPPRKVKTFPRPKLQFARVGVCAALGALTGLGALELVAPSWLHPEAPSSTAADP